MGFLYTSLVSLGLVGSFTLISGGLSLGFTPRIHLGILLLVLTVIDLGFVANRNRHPVGKGFAVGLSTLLFAFGLVEGLYDHLFKDVLYGHGLPQPLIDTLVPSLLGGPGPLWTEIAGWLLGPIAVGGLIALRALGNKREEE
jgi:hypothetical protein